MNNTKTPIKCSLCNLPILNYNIQLNQLKINESHSINICQDCIDKFSKWQQNIYAQLFPTKIMKKRYNRDNKDKPE